MRALTSKRSAVNRTPLPFGCHANPGGGFPDPSILTGRMTRLRCRYGVLGARTGSDQRPHRDVVVIGDQRLGSEIAAVKYEDSMFQNLA
jgi:hypothetical protein